MTRQHIGPTGLDRMLRAAPALRVLVAGACDLTSLEALHHDGAPIDRLELHHNAIGSAGMTAIVRAPRLVDCKQLVLDTCELDAGAIELLVTASCWDSLCVLDLSRNTLDRRAMLALATAQPPAELHTLKLADIEVDREAMLAFATAPWLGQLLEIDLAKLPVPASLLAKLSGAKSLCLADAVLDEVDLTSACERVVHLDLGGTGARLPTTALELQVLRVARCGLDVRSLARLLGGAYPNVVELDLSGNVFDEEMVAALARNEIVRRASRLVLKGVRLDTASIDLLAAQGLGALDLLDLRDVNGYTAEEMLRFARSTALREIKRIAFHGAPWTFPPPVRDELVERFGARWYAHDDEPVVDDEEDP